MAFSIRRAATAFKGIRTMSTAPVISVDWAAIRGSMISEKARNNIDRVKDSFNNRLTAAGAIGNPPEIDWAYYKERLPSVDIDALKTNYEAFQAAVPSIAYDPTADIAAATKQEAAWQQFTQYCIDRVAELEELKKESEEHKLHEQYTLNRAFQRFDGLFEAEWAKMQSMDFESTLDAPDTSESLGEAVKSELRAEIAQLTGLPVSFLGSNEEK